MLLLSDTESLTQLARDGMNPIILPTSNFREIFTWSLAYLTQNDKAPSLDIMKQRWGDTISDGGIDLDSEIEETVQWAIDDLKQDYVKLEVGKFTRMLATSIATAQPEETMDVLGERASQLSKIYFDLQPRTTRMDIRESGPDILAAYEMAANSDGVRGMRTGLLQIDQHFGGIWPGELFVLGGPAGSGKSFFADFVAHSEWARGVNTGIFTLENSIEMTQMRIACMALQIDCGQMQRGQLGYDPSTGQIDPDENARLVALLREWCNDVLVASDTPLHIINPEMVARSPQAVVQMAKALEIESLIVDQLSHMAPVDTQSRDRRNEVSSIVRMLADQISTGRNRIPCLLLHQINREGIKRAASTGRLVMTDMAESSEVERSASVAASLYQSEDDKDRGEMQWQTLKVRRAMFGNWSMDWAPHRGMVQVLNTIDLSGMGEGES